MGFAVIHLEKAKGTDSGMSAHIERTIDPKNADKERTHLNRELVKFPDGVENRTEAIQYRLDNAGLTRKVGSNQVRALRVMLSGTHEDMMKIESEGRLDEWCRDNLEWLCQTYGRDNVVSVVLHLDEKTPHIHATVVPIVTTERVKRKREESVKKTYRKKKPSPRLCCDEVMGRDKLEKYQDDYAEVMAKYGLKRGRRGSEARHVSTSEYYKDLQQQSESLQNDISQLLEQQEAVQKELSANKSDISKEKLKNSAANIGSKLLDSASSLLGTPKVKRLETENEQLKEDIKQVKFEANFELENRKRDFEVQYNHDFNEFQRKESKLQQEIDRLKGIISKVVDLVPEMPAYLRFTQLCKTIGFGIETIRQLINGDEVRFNGDLYSELHNKRFHTDGSVAKRYQSNDRTEDAKLLIDNKPHDEWFREQHQKQAQTFKTQQRRGRRM